MAPKRRRQEIRTSEVITQEQLENITKQLTVISRCLGVLALRMAASRPKTDTERILFLNALGFDRREVAGMLDIAPQTVSSRLSERRSRRKRARRGKN